LARVVGCRVVLTHGVYYALYRVLMQVCCHAWRMMIILHLIHPPVNSTGDAFLHEYSNTTQ